MKKFIRDIKRYNPYTMYAAKAELKSSVADSYLNWLWWILDPVLFMLIYSFLAQIIFNSREDNFAVFVFIGLTAWDFFNRTITNSVKLVKSNKSVVTKIYIPKYMLILTKMYVNLFKMCISFGLVVITMILYGVQVSLNILWHHDSFYQLQWLQNDLYFLILELSLTLMARFLPQDFLW